MPVLFIKRPPPNQDFSPFKAEFLLAESAAKEDWTRDFHLVSGIPWENRPKGAAPTSYERAGVRIARQAPACFRCPRFTQNVGRQDCKKPVRAVPPREFPDSRDSLDEPNS
jgi:hypothetical protein